MSETFNTPWRRTAATIYRKPSDSKIIGSVSFDVTELNRYIQSHRQAGVKVTPTHVFTLATARAIAEVVPEMNTYIRRGKVVSHPQIDATVSVLLKGGQMGSVKLSRADQLTLREAVSGLSQKIKQARQQADESQRLKNRLGNIPWPLRNGVYRLLHWLTVTMGVSLPGLSPHQFGSFVVSNIGSLGLDIGYPALLPAANLSFVLLLGGQEERPAVVNGEIVIRTFLKVGIAMDHRMLDASHGGALFKYLKKVIRKPQQLEEMLLKGT